jgi:hypothetical protein
MRSSSRLAAWMVPLALVFLAMPALADSMEATISLSRDPEPPLCVTNPGGTLTIEWHISHLTTPRYVYFKLEDPTRTIILDQQTYPGSTGLDIVRTWTVPPGLSDGKYWVRVEYWSYQAGNEANAEVTFYVCNFTSSICATKYQDTNCDGLLGPGDTPVPGWWICMTTPLGDTFCEQTGAGGQICWAGLPYGNYTIFEIVAGPPSARIPIRSRWAAIRST